jgi:glycerol-3-phosphate acyltransferase PlsX
MLPIAVDAMGGDHAPGVVLAGVRRAVDDGIPVVLVGPTDLVHDDDIELISANELIAMDEEPGTAVRTKKDSTLVRAAEAVRDGKASAMVSAGNTGATMAAALLRIGRIKGVKRPAIATPIPVPGGASPTVLLDAGANAEVQPDWLVQFAQMGSVYARTRFHVDKPRVGLLSIGEEPGKGDSLRKEAYPLLAAAPSINFIGNIEGRDVMSDNVDVAVTDGFTGNVTLKTLEGGMKALIAALLAAFAEDGYKAHADALLPALVPLYNTLNPDTYGGAVLLGVDGVCIISHGSSGATAIRNAIGVAAEMVEQGMVAEIRAVV